MKTKEYRRRRKQLMDMTGAGSIAVLPTAAARLRNRDVEFPFSARQ